MIIRRNCLVVCLSWVIGGCSGPNGGDGDTPLYRLQVGGRIVFPSSYVPPVPGTVVAAYYGLDAPENYDRCHPAFLSSNGTYSGNAASGDGWGIETDYLQASRFVRALGFWTPRAAEVVSNDPDYALGRIPLQVGDRYGETAMHSQGPCDPPDPSGATCFQGSFSEIIVLTSTITEACP